VVGEWSFGSPPRHWARLDDAIADILGHRGYQPAVLEPPVRHLP